MSKNVNNDVSKDPPITGCNDSFNDSKMAGVDLEALCCTSV